MRVFLGALLFLSLFMVSYDYKWYGEKTVPIPFISVVMATTAAFIYLLMKKIVAKSPIKMPKEFRMILLLFFALQVSIIGLCLNDPTNEKIFQFLRTSVHLLFYVLLVFTIVQLLDFKLLQKIMKFYYVCGIIAACLGILQFMHLDLFRIPGMDQLLFGSKKLLAMGPIRVTSVFNEPSVLSYFLLDWLAIGLAYFLVRGRKIQLLGLVPILVAFYFCGSVGGYIGLSVMALLLLYKFPTTRRQLVLIVIIIIIPLMIWIFPSDYFKESISNRIAQITSGIDPSMSMRLDSAQAAVKVWLKSPVVGVGIGNASFYTPLYYEAGWLLYTEDSLFHITADSVFLIILAENGMIGFIAVIIMMLTIIKQQRQVMPLKSPPNNNALLDENDEISSGRDILIFANIFRIVVIVNFIGFISSGAFLFPRVWFDMGLLLSVKIAIGSQAAAVTR